MLIRENLPSSAQVSKRNLLHSPMMTRSPGLNSRVPQPNTSTSMIKKEFEEPEGSGGQNEPSSAILRANCYQL